jgi:hypothetical protein
LMIWDGCSVSDPSTSGEALGVYVHVCARASVCIHLAKGMCNEIVCGRVTNPVHGLIATKKTRVRGSGMTGVV